MESDKVQPISQTVIKKLIENDIKTLYPKIYKKVARYLNNEIQYNFFYYILKCYNKNEFDQKYRTGSLKFHFFNDNEKMFISIETLNNTNNLSVNIIDSMMKSLEFINISLKHIEPCEEYGINRINIYFDIKGDEIDIYLALARLKNYIKFIKNKKK